MSRIVRLSFLIILVVAAAAIASGQSTVSGAIGGSVTNPNKEVVPGAAVTIRSTETNKEDSATTDDQGRFLIPQLAPGVYFVTINAAGFNAFSQDRVVVEVGRVTSLDVPLAIGQVTGSVEITAEAPVINTAQQDFSSNINQTSINELPINGRRWSNFALLTPGATPDGDFGLISFRGISGLLNNNTVDGGDNNQAFFSEERGRTRISYVISQASIREFQVNTSNYSAEYGRSAGGVVNAVTKSGTNEFHGSIFFYDRDNKWGARNPLGFRNVLVGTTVTREALKPKDQRYQFGGTIGGPIVKDKLFFFFSYDEQKRDFPGIAAFSTATFLSTVNTANLIAPSRGLTTAQINAGTAFLLSLTGEVPRKQNQRIFFPKIDWRINTDHTLTATLNRMRSASPNGLETGPIINKGKASFGDDFVDVDMLNLRLSSTLSSTVLNEARFVYTKERNYAFSVAPAPGEPLTGTDGKPPEINITGGLTPFGKQEFFDRVNNPLEKQWQYTDTVTLSVGNHTIKFGGDLRRVNDLRDNLFRNGGKYSYGNINDFLVDYTNFTTGGSLRAAGKLCSTSTRVAGLCYTSNFQQGFGAPITQFSTTDINFFIQDDYRVSPRLTLNLGLRYEYQMMPEVPSDLSPVPQLDSANPNAFVFRGTHFPNDKNNLGPRFGFAYDLTGDGKTSVRGGYGIYFGRISNSYLVSAITGTATPTRERQIDLRASDVGAPIFPLILTTAGTSPFARIFFAPEYANPEIHQADLVLERQIANNTVVSASVLLSLGRKLPGFVDINLLRPTANRTFTIVGGDLNGQTISVPTITSRIDPTIGAVTRMQSNIKSEYTALVLQMNRRLTKGLQFQTSYTFSKATDTGQLSQTFTPSSGTVPLNPFDLSLEPGLSNFNIPHKFVASVVYKPNFFGEDQKVARAIFNGFTFSPIVNAQSGRPYTGFVSGFPSGAPGQGVFGSGSTNSRLPIFERNSLQRPRIVNVDLRVSRRFGFTESTNLEVLAEAFNLLNRTHITDVNSTQYRIGGTAAAQTLTFDNTIGSVRTTGNTLFRERQVQLAVRFHF